MSERECDNPKPSDVLMRCDGASIKVALCDDAQVCGAGKTRMTPIEFAGQQCAKFNQHVPLIDPKGKGMQAAYSASTSYNLFDQSQSIKDNNSVFYFSQNVSFNRTPMAIVRHFLQTIRS